MKPAAVLVLVLVLLFVVSVILFIPRSQDPPPPANSPTQTDNRRPRRPSPPAFDDSPAPRVVTIDPAALGVALNPPPVDHATRITAAIDAADDATLVYATVSWFSVDPHAACAWLNSQPTLEDLQPTLAGVANHLAERGDFQDALRWAEAITATQEKEQALFAIYALGYRNGEFSMETLQTARLPPEMIAELESGAAGD